MPLQHPACQILLDEFYRCAAMVLPIIDMAAREQCMLSTPLYPEMANSRIERCTSMQNSHSKGDSRH